MASRSATPRSSLCGDHLPADRAFPLLDQARPGQRRRCSPRCSSKWASGWPRRRASRTATGCGCGRSAASIKAKAVVTKRITPLMCDGKTVHIVGMPIHWGFIGRSAQGFGANTLTPFVGDANVETPEYKAFLVDIEPDQPASGIGRRDHVNHSSPRPLPPLGLQRLPAARRAPAHDGGRQADRRVANASAARPARPPAWSGTTSTRRSASPTAPTTTRTDLTPNVVDA